MEDIHSGLLSRFRRAPTRGVTLIGTDGQVIHAEDGATRLNRLITQTLGQKRLALRLVGAAPIELSDEDNEDISSEVREALDFARRAS